MLWKDLLNDSDKILIFPEQRREASLRRPLLHLGQPEDARDEQDDGIRGLVAGNLDIIYTDALFYACINGMKACARVQGCISFHHITYSVFESFEYNAA